MTITKEQLTEWYHTANKIPQGKAPPITTEKIFAAMLYAYKAGKSAVSEPPIKFKHGCKWCGQLSGCEHVKPTPAASVPAKKMVTPYITQEHFDRAFPVSEPVAWMSKTGHGVYFRESITPELAALEHGGNKMWTPLYTTPPAEAKALSNEEERKEFELWIEERTKIPEILERVLLKDNGNPKMYILQTTYAAFEAWKGRAKRTPPAEAKREPLTDEQIFDALKRVDHVTQRLPIGLKLFARAIEAAHNIGAKE